MTSFNNGFLICFIENQNIIPCFVTFLPYYPAVLAWLFACVFKCKVLNSPQVSRIDEIEDGSAAAKSATKR